MEEGTKNNTPVMDQKVSLPTKCPGKLSPVLSQAQTNGTHRSTQLCLLQEPVTAEGPSHAKSTWIQRRCGSFSFS